MSQQSTTNPSDTFNFHYARLQEIATRLQQGQVDIDELEHLVKQSLESKQYCEKRIARVKQAVDGLLETQMTDSQLTETHAAKNNGSEHKAPESTATDTTAAPTEYSTS